MNQLGTCTWHALMGRTLGTLLLVGIVATSSLAFGADHLDAPATQADSAADINDLYVFRSPDTDPTPARTVFVMTVVPQATVSSRFSDAVTYEFVISNDTETATITCTATADATQMITCTDPADNSDTVALNAVEPGDPNNENMRIFAGLRDDPFFFDLDDFNTVVDDVLDGGGDPDPTPLLASDTDNNDFFAGLNALAIVVEVRNANLPSGLLRVQARTVRTGEDSE